MGAWIEISWNHYSHFIAYVAPGMGAWIEILVTIGAWYLPYCRSRYGSVD